MKTLALVVVMLSFSAFGQEAVAPCANEQAALKLQQQRTGGTAAENAGAAQAMTQALAALGKCQRDASDRSEAEADAQAKAAERRQAAEAAADGARVSGNAHDPKIGTVALSGAICFNGSVRAAALREIAQQKKYSKVGGALDLGAIRDQQNFVREADEGDASIRRTMTRLHFKALSCSDVRVRPVVACLAAGYGSDREDADPPAACRAGELGKQMETIPDRNSTEVVSL